MITKIIDKYPDNKVIEIGRKGTEENLEFQFESWDGEKQRPIQQVFESYTTQLLITILNELYNRLNECPPENELPTIEYISKKLTEEIDRRLYVAEKNLPERNKLINFLMKEKDRIAKKNEEIMKKIVEGKEK